MACHREDIYFLLRLAFTATLFWGLNLVWGFILGLGAGSHGLCSGRYERGNGHRREKECAAATKRRSRTFLGVFFSFLYLGVFRSGKLSLSLSRRCRIRREKWDSGLWLVLLDCPFDMVVFLCVVLAKRTGAAQGHIFPLCRSDWGKCLPGQVITALPIFRSSSLFIFCPPMLSITCPRHPSFIPLGSRGMRE